MSGEKVIENNFYIYWRGEKSIVDRQELGNGGNTLSFVSRLLHMKNNLFYHYINSVFYK
jgi:hypothetical protein